MKELPEIPIQNKKLPTQDKLYRNELAEKIREIRKERDKKIATAEKHKRESDKMTSNYQFFGINTPFINFKKKLKKEELEINSTSQLSEAKLLEKASHYVTSQEYYPDSENNDYEARKLAYQKYSEVYQKHFEIVKNIIFDILKNLDDKLNNLKYHYNSGHYDYGSYLENKSELNEFLINNVDNIKALLSFQRKDNEMIKLLSNVFYLIEDEILFGNLKDETIKKLYSKNFEKWIEFIESNYSNPKRTLFELFKIMSFSLKRIHSEYTFDEEKKENYKKDINQKFEEIIIKYINEILTKEDLANLGSFNFDIGIGNYLIDRIVENPEDQEGVYVSKLNDYFTSMFKNEVFKDIPEKIDIKFLLSVNPDFEKSKEYFLQIFKAHLGKYLKINFDLNIDQDFDFDRNLKEINWQANLEKIKKIEKIKSGSCKLLNQKFGIREFYRYPDELLLSQLNFFDEELLSDNYVIYINPKSDHNKAFDRIKFENNSLKNASKNGIKIIIFECGSVTELYKTILRLTNKGQRYAKALILSGHGSTVSTQLGQVGKNSFLYSETISYLINYNKKNIPASVYNLFNPNNPVFILESCSAGADDEKGLARHISIMLNNVTVYASRLDASGSLNINDFGEISACFRETNTLLDSTIIWKNGNILGN